MKRCVVTPPRKGGSFGGVRLVVYLLCDVHNLLLLERGMMKDENVGVDDFLCAAKG